MTGPHFVKQHYIQLEYLMLPIHKGPVLYASLNINSKALPMIVRHIFPRTAYLATLFYDLPLPTKHIGTLRSRYCMIGRFLT